MLGKKPNEGVTIRVEQLRVGLYVSLEAYWLDHPFLFNQFRLGSQDQIDTIRGLGVDTVIYYPDKSTTVPLPWPEDALNPIPEPVSTVPEPVRMSESERLPQQQKPTRIARLAAQKDRIARCDKRYVHVAGAVRDVTRNLFSASDNARRQLDDLVTEAACGFIEDHDVILHLLNGRRADDANHFHALNVMVLSLLLGTAVGLDEEAMHDLAIGALFHDLGKDKVPASIIKKPGKRAKYEEDFFRLHTQYGEDMAKDAGFVAKPVLHIIRHHHEAMDGSGYPDGLEGRGIKLLTRIVAIANRYDNLCNAVVADQALAPSEALSQMFKHELSKYDPTLMNLFIKMLGIYPPGSFVQLSDGSIGLVIDGNNEDILRPSVLLYDERLPRQEAPIVALTDAPDLKVDQVLRPNQLTPEILDYLTPRRRFNYASAATKNIRY